jgi:large subunit ribosomal protein L30
MTAKTGKSATPEKVGKTILIEQIASPIRCPTRQRETLVGLGLNKIRKQRTVVDNAAIRGMIRKVSHLVRIVEEPAAK